MASLDYKMVLEALSAPTLVLSEDLKIEFLNSAAQDLMETDNNKASDRSLDDVFNIDASKWQELQASLRSNVVFELAVLYQHNHVEQSEWKIRLKPILDPNQSLAKVIVEVKAQTQELEIPQTIAFIGQAVGKLAHDISNPLAVLRIHCDNFSLKAQKQDQFSSSEITERVKKLLTATGRLGDTTDKLKTIAKSIISGDLEKVKSLFADQESTS